MIPARHVALIAALLLPAAMQAQRPARFATATVAVTAYVNPVLTIEAIAESPAVAQAGEAAGPAWTSRVAVRGNLPHQVLVRPAGGATAQLRAAGGQWVSADALTPLDLAGTLGQSIHEVECRGTADACALSYELRSTDARFPMRVTGSLRRAAPVAAVSTVATTS